MKRMNIIRTILFLALGAAVSTSFAGGRYEDPPMNLMEVYTATQKALDAAKAGDKAAALENAKQGRKLAIESYKEKSTMPMQVASGTLKSALASIEGDKLAEAIPELEHGMAKLQEDVDYYKKAGKLK
ncbi:MAG: hypothetical protein U1E83_08435 [Methylotetracoccus sp.]